MGGEGRIRGRENSATDLKAELEDAEDPVCNSCQVWFQGGKASLGPQESPEETADSQHPSGLTMVSSSKL